MLQAYTRLQHKLSEKPANANYRWFILALVVVTNIIVVATPTMSMSVLAQEISLDLNLTVVQVGVIWGVSALPGIITSLLGGALGDQIGPKTVIAISALLTGLLGAARGLATDFNSMMIFVFIIGALIPFVTMNGFKACGMWFSSKELGLANGIISMGMALGFLIGSLTSATYLSPLLGGWRNVFILYGLVGAALSIIWVFTRSAPVDPTQQSAPAISMKNAIAHVIKSRNIWLLGFGLLGLLGSIQAVLGYLPLYLRTIGWEPIQADSALAAFHTASLIFVLPISFFADKAGIRKRLVLITAVLITVGITLLSANSYNLIWLAVLMAGFTRDGSMALILTMTMETETIGPLYAGTATGLVMAFGGLGSFLAPPIGNSLADIRPGAPFLLWGALAAFGLLCMLFVKNTAPRLDAEPLPAEGALS